MLMPCQHLLNNSMYLGYKGWKLANTEDDKRSLIKKAIELHRYKGTVWAVKEAMKSIGFTDAVLIEHTGSIGQISKCSFLISRCPSQRKALLICTR
jgi:phage tail P2-like protein